MEKAGLCWDPHTANLMRKPEQPDEPDEPDYNTYFDADHPPPAQQHGARNDTARPPASNEVPPLTHDQK